ncbi:MAG: protocatechuate 3,4-dioxygenase subunit alpha [Pseudolabrys sp.]|nr:protocatechuate 3,4-dioxygenase subunit alpha [Pseudolabrys sp.]
MAGKDRADEQDRGITPSQTVGPFFAYGLTPKGRAHWDPNGTYSWKETVGDNLVTPDATGDKIHVEGQIRDGDGVPITDAMIEIWQADAQGRYANLRDPRAPSNAKFKGFGRSATNKEGVFGFDTIKPGSVPGPGGKPQAPHIVFCIFSRGMLRQIYTRMYFPDEKANDADPNLKLVPTDRRNTLIATKQSRNGQTVYRFDIRVQGQNETVFFDI